MTPPLENDRLRDESLPDERAEPASALSTPVAQPMRLVGQRRVRREWLIGAVGIAVLLALVIALGIRADRNGVRRDTAGTSGRAAPGIATGGTLVTDVGDLERGGASLIGRTADLQDVRIHSVAGDRAFWVGERVGSRFLIVVDEHTRLAPGQRQIAVRPGQRVSVSGLVREVTDVAAARQGWALNASDARALDRGDVYLQARTVTLLD